MLFKLNRTSWVQTVMLFVVFAMMHTTQSSAQARSEGNMPNDTAYIKPGWQLGVNLLPLILKSDLSVGTLNARNVYGASGNRSKALRLGLWLNAETQDYKGHISDTVYTTNQYVSYSPYVSIGHEWLRSKGRFSVMYGSEFYFSYSQSSGNEERNVPESDSEIKSRFSAVGANALLGVQYAATQRIAFRLESVLGFGYSSRTNSQISHYTSNGVKQEYNSTDTFSGFNVKAQPIYQLSLLYNLSI